MCKTEPARPSGSSWKLSARSADRRLSGGLIIHPIGSGCAIGRGRVQDTGYTGLRGQPDFTRAVRRCRLPQRSPASVPSVEKRGNTMAAGTVKWFNATKGFGFITPDDGTARRLRPLLVDRGFGLSRAHRRTKSRLRVRARAPRVSRPSAYDRCNGGRNGPTRNNGATGMPDDVHRDEQALLLRDQGRSFAGHRRALGSRRCAGGERRLQPRSATPQSQWTGRPTWPRDGEARRSR